MHCPKCQFENPDGSIFCLECGCKFQHSCPQCGKAILPDDKFCNTCGHNLKATIKAKPEDRPKEKLTPLPSSNCARKYVTVLFSDMSSYTAMTEKLDPEDIGRRYLCGKNPEDFVKIGDGFKFKTIWNKLRE